MKRTLLAFLALFFTVQLHAADYYWVGGGGNWSDLNGHWRLGSPTGGVPSIVPATGDNVFFGSYSGFTAVSRTVTLDANSFCANMTWESDVPNNPILARTGSNTLFIYGNLVLAPTVTYSGVVNVEFAGNNPGTLTANGTIDGILNLAVNKPGSGLTLMDDLVYTGSTGNNAYGLTLTAGYLDASGRNVAVFSFWSENDNPRHLDITGGRLSVLRNFYFRGANKTTAAEGSYIQSAIRLVTDGGEFDEVEALSNNPNNDLFSVYNTTFRKLVFSNPSLTSNARIHAGNIVDSLIFMGAGVVRDENNVIKYLTFAGNAAVGGSNNTIQYAEIGGALEIIDNGAHVFDTLYTAPNKNITVRGTVTINKIFRAGGVPCDGFTEIMGSSGGTIHFADGAVAEIDNVLLTNIAATGSITPLTVNGVDNEGNSGFIINTPTTASRTLYWVGGSGDWSDRNHWSETSGGTGGACIPFVTDNVVFNGASGLNAGSVITTSGNAYCRDMTWAGDLTGNITFNESNNYLLRVYGSVILNPNVTMNAMLYFTGEEDVTFTNNNSTQGVLETRIYKSGPAADIGTVALSDNWSNPQASVVWLRGDVDIRDRVLDINVFSGVQSMGGHLNMRDASVTVNNWEFLNPSKTVDAAGSYILAKTNIGIRTGSFYQVESSATNVNRFDIATATIDFLTFSNPSLTSEAWIGSGNTIGTLEFKGRGMIRYGGNTIDSLIIGESRNFRFFASNTINKYFKATHPACSGLGEIRSGEGTSTIVFGADAEVDIANVYMENMVATGGGGTLTLPISFSGADAGGNTGWNINTSDGDARYWVGGAGDWNDALHWSTESGGAGGACIPTVANDVYFDANSGFGTTAAARTITVSSGNAYFRNMDWTGAANNPILNKAEAWNMEAWGESVVLNPASTLNAIIQFRGTAETTLEGQSLGDLDFELRKPGGRLVLANDYNNSQTDIFLYEGNLTATDVVLNIRSVDNEERNNNLSIDISGSTVNAAAHWRYNGDVSNRSLNAAGSTIISNQLLANGFSYDQVTVGGSVANHGRFSNITATKIVFTDAAVASQIGINGANNQLDTVEFKGGGRIYETNNTIGTLIFFPGSRYTFDAGTNTIITDSWFGSGTPCRLTEIVSSGTTNATVTKATGTVDFDYIRLERMTAAGGAEFTAGSHSQDLGGSNGWDIAPYDGVSAIEGLGPDVSLSNAEFPYTISAAGFFGSPLSQYEWRKDGTVVGTDDELVITEPGTYTIKVDFPDGCSVTDEIVISLDVADLVTVKTLKEAAQASYVPGEDVAYTITITNNGPDDAVDVSIADEAPTGTAISSWTATVTAGTVDLPNASGAGNLAETIPLLPNGAEVVYEVTLATGSGRTADLSNTVEVTTTTPDPVPDCEDCTTTPIPAAPVAAVSVTKELADGSQQGYAPGDDVVYTITVTNDGPSDAREVVIEDVAPAGTTISGWAAVVTAGEVTLPATSGTGDLDQIIPVLPSGAVVTYTVTVQTPADFTADLVNTVSVTADTEDPDETDNTAATSELPSVPDAPVGADQIECAESPVQTLTAIATVPDGVTVAWYDAATGGNVVTTPVLNAIGTVTYYAEAQKGALVSLTRTAVTLTINELPNLVITDPAVACAGTTIDLTAAAITTGSDGGLTYTYYTDAPGTAILEDADAVAVSGTYYIRATDPVTGCGVLSPVVVQFVDRPVVTVVHPDCVTGTGSISITDPLGAGFEYSINGVDYQSDPLFDALTPGTYSVTAQHVSVPGCISEAQEVIINATPTTLTPAVIQPDCDNPLGQIEFPVNPDYEYAVYQTGETPVYQPSPIFADVPAGTYEAAMRLIAGGCDALPVTITINEAPEVPAAPVSGGDQTECATSPLQTLTAEATAPAGSIITWYDELTGGNVVTAPTLNAVGTVTYYAEAGNGDCVSETRTAVTLTINAQPVIDPIDDQVVCGSFTLPDITGTNLTGDRAYYAEAGANGTRYEIGDVISMAGNYTLYQYATTAEGCATELVFTFTINETAEAGVIGADQSICYEETPAELTSVTPGSGSGAVTYRWEQSANGTTWHVIPAAVGETYQPGALTTTMHYRRTTVATSGGITCESIPTDAVTVNVTGELAANAGADQTEYHNSVFTLNANVPTLGTGEWSVVSTEQPAVFTDVTNPAATITLLPNTSVTLRWTVTEGDCSVFDEVTLTSINGADVEVTKTLKDVDQLGYVPGSDVAYIITVRNNGPAYAEGVRIQDTAPVGTEIANWTAEVTAGSVFLPRASGTGDLDETILILPVDAAVTYEVMLRTSADISADLVNTAEVATDTDDADLSNNTAATSGLPAVPDAPISGGDQEVCAESPVQTLTATATVLDGQTIVWYNAASGGDVVTLPVLNEIGTVTYYAEAVKGVLVSESRTAVTLTINALPILVITDPAVACAGSTVDLTAVAITAGSDAGLTFAYYLDEAAIDELTTPDAVTASGTYYIRATDPVTGCSTLAPVAVQFVDRPVAVVTHPDCVTGTGSIAITEPLGADFEYSINGVDYQANPLFENVAPGTYKITAQHASVPGCVSEEVEVTISATPTTTLPSVVNPGCGETTGTVEFPADTDYEYAVYQSGETPVYQSSPVFADLAPGEYLAQMRSLVIDCEAVAVTVTIEAAPEIPAAPLADDQVVCAESPLQTLTATATVPDGTSVVWYDAPIGGLVVADPILNAVGTVTYYAEASNGDCVSETRTPVTLTINALPTLIITDPAIACAGETVDLTAAAITAGSDAGLTYAYYLDAAAIDELTTPNAVTASGTYYIRATDPLTGCSTIAPVTVQFVDRPVVVITHPDCVVGTGSIAITEPLGAGFEYSINGVDYQADPLFENVTPGTYRVTAQHVSVPGCVSEEVEVTIDVTPTTIMPSVVHPACGKNTGTIEFPANGDYEYAIYQAGETPVYQSSPVFADLAPGEYLAQMRSVAIDCEAIAITVTINAAPDVPASPISGGDQEVCAESPLQTLTATATVPEGTTIVWYDAPTGGNVVADPILDAVGTVTYYAEASNGDCVSETRTPVTLNLLEMLVADAGADQTKAEGPVFTLDGHLPAGTTGTWSVVAGTPATAISDINDPQATVSLAPGASVTLRWTINNSSCDAADEVVLTLLQAPEADLGITKTVDTASPLAGSTVVFTIEVRNEGPDDATGVEVRDELPDGYTFVSAETSTGGYDAATGVWAIGSLANGDATALRITALVNTEGEYLNSAEVFGNEDDPDAVNNAGEASVTPVHPPQAIDDSATGNSNKALIISVLGNDTERTYPLDAASVEIVTQPQHGTLGIGPDGTITYTSERGYVGEDRFTYRVKDSEGHWSETAEVTITVAANPLRIPNIFTPNGDGQNDRFEIIGIEGFDRAEIVLFNRWGNEIYRHNDYDNSWGGGAINEGTYYYMLTLHKGGSKQVEKGWVVLKKQ